jgi:hypothetical protein
MSATRKLAAILAADVVGFSRLTGADEDRTLARLRALRSDVIDPTISVHHGRVVKRTGDGALVEFRSLVDDLSAELLHRLIRWGLVEETTGRLTLTQLGYPSSCRRCADQLDLVRSPRSNAWPDCRAVNPAKAINVQTFFSCMGSPSAAPARHPGLSPNDVARRISHQHTLQSWDVPADNGASTHRHASLNRHPNLNEEQRPCHAV